jgi:hypothetical protein
VAADVDGDGDTDFIAGNVGSNNNYRTSAEYPMKLYVADIDKNGSVDPVMFYYIKDQDGKKKLFPSISRDQLAAQVPAVKKKWLLNKDFAKVTPEDIFPDDKGRTVLTCNETQSCWLENAGNGKFIKHVLPKEVQLAPVNAIVCTDLDGDGISDILLAGNEYQTEVMTGRYDASYGSFLKGMGNKTFTAIPPLMSGFKIDGDVKDMKLVTTPNKQKLILVAVNNDKMKVFKVK